MSTATDAAEKLFLHRVERIEMKEEGFHQQLGYSVFKDRIGNRKICVNRKRTRGKGFNLTRWLIKVLINFRAVRQREANR